MRSLSPKEYSTLLDKIRYKAWFYNFPPNKWRTIKYVQSSFDTRTWEVWLIDLDNWKFIVREDDNDNRYKTIGHKVMAFINKEID